MASKNSASLALFFALNILFFTLTAATLSVPSPHPRPVTPPSTPGSSGNCPINVLKLGVCANVLSGLLKGLLGQPSPQPCCSLLGGLADLEAAVCLCTAIKANILGINFNIPLSLSLLLNACNKNLPSGFQCA